MTKNKYKYWWQYVMAYNPFLQKEDVEEIKELNEWDLLIGLKNGKRIIYDRYTGYYREIFFGSINELTDEQERKEFAYKLRQMMNRKHITQEAMAELIGVSQTMISHYITGRCLPSILIVRKMAKILDCSIDDLFHKEY